jgi:rubrerythrin
MAKMNDPKIIASYIHCLSTLEDKTSRLYQNLSDKAEMPIVKTLLLNIAQDSAKHATLLLGIADSMAVSRKNPKDCAKKLGVVWQTIATFHEKIVERTKISNSEFSQLAEKLTVLESAIGEEYYVFIQMKTLQLMSEEINQLYKVDVGHLQGMFESIISDEEHHRELLATIKEHLAENSEKTYDNNIPKIMYQNPDAWIHSLPPTA